MAVILFVIAVLLAGPATAQTTTSPTRPIVAHVICDSGCAGSGGAAGPTDTDDGSVAGGQTAGLNLSLLQLWTGTVWARAPGDATSGLKVQFNTPPHVICDSGCAAGAPGQQTMANSSPVVIASDQSAVAVSAQVNSESVFTESSYHPLVLSTTGALKIGGTVACSTCLNVLGQVDAASSAPGGTESGLIVRNIPSGTQAVSGTFWPATQPVSGTFWQATQPVSGPLTDTQLRASALPVSGTFWQSTQPVSGTFWQATQPVSLAVAPTTPVTGTFWQATQPVSGTFWQATQPVSGPLTDTQLRAAPLQFLQAQTVRTAGTLTSTTCPGTGCVSITTTNYTIATVTITGTYSLTPVFEFSDDGVTFYSTTCTRTDAAIQETSPGAIVNTSRAWDCSVFSATSFRVRASVFVSGTANIGITLSAASIEAAPTVSVVGSTAKGAQPSSAIPTQQLSDSGRTLVTLTAERVTPILTTDTIVTFSKLVGDTVTAAQTTYAVSAGKTLRLSALSISMTPTSTTAAVLTVRLRTLSSGACTVAAGLRVGSWEISNPIGTMAANQGNQNEDIMFPEGMEFSGATRNICLSMNVLGAAAQAVTITLSGYEY